jgi:hypothetical protein
MYETSPGIPELAKKRLLDQIDNTRKIERQSNKLHRKKSKTDITLQSLDIQSRQHNCSSSSGVLDVTKKINSSNLQITNYTHRSNQNYWNMFRQKKKKKGRLRNLTECRYHSSHSHKRKRESQGDESSILDPCKETRLQKS